MGYFKIRNITSQLGKRHIKSNTTQTVELTKDFQIEKINIAPDSELLIETSFLPISLHKMRTAGLISIVELDKNSFQRALSEQNSTSEVSENKVVDSNDDVSDDSKKSAVKVQKRDK